MEQGARGAGPLDLLPRFRLYFRLRYGSFSIGNTEPESLRPVDPSSGPE
jgi:hypothetical protein